MKPWFTPRSTRGGYALLIVMSAAAALLLLVASTMRRTASTAITNDRNQRYSAGMYAAEADVEKVVARMRSDYANGGVSFLLNNLSVYQAMVPTTSEDPYWGVFSFSDACGHANASYVRCISNTTFSVLSGPYAGLQGWSTVFRVLSDATQITPSYHITNAVQVDLEADTVPVFQFAIFYNSLLEFTWAAPLTVRGPVHANSSIFLGSSSSLAFNAYVTASGQLLKTNWGGYTMSQFTGTISFATNLYGGYATNYPVLTLPIGTNSTPAAVREVVNMPPSGESVTSAMGQQRFYNQAAVDLLVSNSTVTAIYKNSLSDSSPITQVITNYGTNSTTLSNAFPFLSITNTFYDSRESKYVVASQLDMGKLAVWSGTNANVTAKRSTSNPFNILYIADNRSSASNLLYSVRLMDGLVLPTAIGSNATATGFTVATPNPVYVWGNYNCTNATYLNTTNTTATVPAAIIGDSLTILSPTWVDSASTTTFKTGVRVATNTTLNAALLAGVVYTSGTTGTSPFSGGVVNFPRLLEDWGNGSSVTLTLNTSMVNLFNSVRATNIWQTPGVYYYAPTRSFNFNANFSQQNGLPPGTPVLNYLYRQKWAVPPPQTTNYFVGS